MKTRVLLVLFISCLVLGHHKEENPPSQENQSRPKRSVSGALHIVTNHVQPIHADVKVDSDVTEKPCPEGIRPSHIEPGVGFQVTPPEHGKYEIKSLRKSLLLPSEAAQRTPPTTIDLVRKISRGVTLIVLFVTVLCKFHTMFW